MGTTVGTPPGVTASGVKPPPQPPTVGLVGWYDADLAASFTYSAGTVVASWADKSSTAAVLGVWQGGGPNRNGTQNGRTTVVFDGVNVMRTWAGVPATTNVDNVTMIVACKRTGGDAATSVPLFNGDPSGNGFGLASRANGANLGGLAGGVGWMNTATPDPLLPAVMTLRRASGTWSMRLNGTATSMSATTAPVTPATMTCVPSVYHLWAGAMFEMMIYAVALTNTELQQAESYLKQKWGTP